MAQYQKHAEVPPTTRTAARSHPMPLASARIARTPAAKLPKNHFRMLTTSPSANSLFNRVASERSRCLALGVIAGARVVQFPPEAGDRVHVRGQFALALDSQASQDVVLQIADRLDLASQHITG